MSDEIEIIVTRSAADDGAVLVIIQTTFEPHPFHTDPGGAGPGLRVVLNDGPIFEGVQYGTLDRVHEAPEHRLTVSLDEIEYR